MGSLWLGWWISGYMLALVHEDPWFSCLIWSTWRCCTAHRSGNHHEEFAITLSAGEGRSKLPSQLAPLHGGTCSFAQNYPPSMEMGRNDRGQWGGVSIGSRLVVDKSKEIRT